MGIPYSSIDPFRTIAFTYVEEDGTVTNFAITQLVAALSAAHAKGKIEPVHIPIEADFAQYCLTNRGIEQHRLDRLTEKHLEEPLVFAQWAGGTQLLIDGHHRYVKHSQLGHEIAPAFILPEVLWRLFVIDDFPFQGEKMSEEEALEMTRSFSGIV